MMRLWTKYKTGIDLYRRYLEFSMRCEDSEELEKLTNARVSETIHYDISCHGSIDIAEEVEDTSSTTTEEPVQTEDPIEYICYEVT